MGDLAIVGPEPGIIRTVGLPGGDARILNMELHRQLIETTPSHYGVAMQSWREHAPLPGGEYGWAEVMHDDERRERWLIEAGQWSHALGPDEPDPVIEERPLIRTCW